MRDEHSVADYGRCKSRRREGSKPVAVSAWTRRGESIAVAADTYSHGCVQRPGDLIILLKSRAAAQDLW
jgi:hypothetical protein